MKTMFGRVAPWGAETIAFAVRSMWPLKGCSGRGRISWAPIRRANPTARVRRVTMLTRFIHCSFHLERVPLANVCLPLCEGHRVVVSNLHYRRFFRGPYGFASKVIVERSERQRAVGT